MTQEELKKELEAVAECAAAYAKSSNAASQHDALHACNDSQIAILAAFAALEQRAEDAELIAWGLARIARQEWDDDPDLMRFTIIYDGEDRWYMNGDWEASGPFFKKLKVYNLPDGRYPTLTPAAREALRKAKEQSK